jgi:hypothetical protein
MQGKQEWAHANLSDSNLQKVQSIACKNENMAAFWPQKLSTFPNNQKFSIDVQLLHTRVWAVTQAADKTVVGSRIGPILESRIRD